MDGTAASKPSKLFAIVTIVEAPSSEEAREYVAAHLEEGANFPASPTVYVGDPWQCIPNDWDRDGFITDGITLGNACSDSSYDLKRCSD